MGIIIFRQLKKKVPDGIQRGFSVTSLARIYGKSVKTISSHKCSAMKIFGIDTDIEILKKLG